MKPLSFAATLILALALLLAVPMAPANRADVLAAGFVFASGDTSQEQPQVELYITSWCPYCKKAIRFFQSRGVPVAVYDIEKDPGAAQRKKQLDPAPGVPFALVNGHKVHGYSVEAYQRALDAK